MELMDIRGYANLMAELGLTGLEITENGRTLRLERSEHGSPREERRPVPELPAPVCADEYINVTSPMVGVFYSSPAEDAEPYVKVGDAVRAGDVLCIIESMKLMNEITAETDGIVAEICAGNHHVVDYGHVLFRLKMR